MKLYVVRHGETAWNKEEVFRGRKDIPLNDTGKRQAEMVGGYFAERTVDRIVASPLSRAMETADAISRTTGVRVEAMEEFTDINFGTWEGVPLIEVEKRFPVDFASWKASPEKARIEGGETLAEVRDRVSRAIAKISSDQVGSIVVATHRVICKMIALSCLNIANNHFWDMKFDPASVTLLEQQQNRFVLAYSNDTCHLQAQSLPSAYRDF
jgi:broad specificity phosphatase PhoE